MVLLPRPATCDNHRSMGPGIIIPLVVVLILVPVVFVWAKRTFKDGTLEVDDALPAPATRLTSLSLRSLASPPWRVVYEIAHDKLGGIEHVLIGPAGVFALQTSMESLPAAPIDDPGPHAVARAAIVRGDLDDTLRRCAMTSDGLVTVYWGAATQAESASVALMPGVTGIDGRRLEEWAATVAGGLSSAQVDLAWQTVTTAIGRPDPLG